jgi:beta-phosphoglucomutase-like phosphatase (HAD superfamily)
MPGLFILTDMLKKAGFRLALASSSNFDHIQIVLKKLNLEDCFEVILSGDHVEKGKPNPEIYQKTAQKLRVRPEQCLVLEDTQTGVSAAKGAKMKCIAVPNQYTKGQDFSKADVRVKSLLDISIKIIHQVMEKNDE